MMNAMNAECQMMNAMNAECQMMNAMNAECQMMNAMNAMNAINARAAAYFKAQTNSEGQISRQQPNTRCQVHAGELLLRHLAFSI